MTPLQRRIGWIAVALAITAGVFYFLDDLTDRLTAAEQDGRATAAALDVANQRLDQLGGQPVTPGTVAGEQGAAGPVGATGQRGQTGTAGRDGRDGSAGSAGTNGQDGSPGPTGATGPAGPAGADGQDGADGSDGRGVESATCSGGTWKITYTDGSTSDGGSCVQPIIEGP